MARLGSFAAPVDLPDHLRPWRAAGLDALFLPDGLPQELPVALTAAPPELQAPSPAANAHAGAAQVNPGGLGATPAPPTPATDIAWPEPWRSIAARLRSKPQIIITYASLTADVTGQANPSRRKLFQAILAYMGWPQGTSLFWPCTDAPDQPELARNIFLNGALSFGVSHIACFGPEASRIATALFPSGPGDTEIRVHPLPEPEELIGLLPHELHRAVAALKALNLE